MTSLAGDNPKSVRLNWNSHKLSLMNSPVKSSKNENTPVAINTNSIIPPIIDLKSFI